LVEEGLESHDAVRRERGQPALKVVLPAGPARRVLQAVGDQLPECVDVHGRTLWHLYPPALSVEIGAERFVLVVLEFASQRL